MKAAKERRIAGIVAIFLFVFGIGMTVWQSIMPSEAIGAMVAVSMVFFFAGWALGIHLTLLRQVDKKQTTEVE